MKSLNSSSFKWILFISRYLKQPKLNSQSRAISSLPLSFLKFPAAKKQSWKMLKSIREKRWKGEPEHEEVKLFKLFNMRIVFAKFPWGSSYDAKYSLNKKYSENPLKFCANSFSWINKGNSYIISFKSEKIFSCIKRAVPVAGFQYAGFWFQCTLHSETLTVCKHTFRTYIECYAIFNMGFHLTISIAYILEYNFHNNARVLCWIIGGLFNMIKLWEKLKKKVIPACEIQFQGNLLDFSGRKSINIILTKNQWLLKFNLKSLKRKLRSNSITSPYPVC